MHNGDSYQEFVEIPEPSFPFLGWYSRPGMARPTLLFLVGLRRNAQGPVGRSCGDQRARESIGSRRLVRNGPRIWKVGKRTHNVLTRISPNRRTGQTIGLGCASGNLQTRCPDMQITERPPTPFSLPQGTVNIATQRWGLEQWRGAPDPLDLQRIWSRKPKFTVDGRRSCAELAVIDHLRHDGWDGVWVSAFGGAWLRAEWFPAPAFRTIAEAGAPAWAVETFERLRAENGGKLGGFFDVFAWREPDEIRFLEIKVARDRIQPTQRRFVETALRFHEPKEFMIIEVPQLI